MKRLEFKNTSQGFVGVVKYNADQKPIGVPVAPGETVVLTEAEAQLTAEAPSDPRDNPFLGRPVERLDPETDEIVVEQRPPLLEHVAEVDDDKLTIRPVPAFGIEGPDPYAAERDARSQAAADSEAASDAAREQAAADAAREAETEQRLAAERADQEAAAAAAAAQPPARGETPAETEQRLAARNAPPATPSAAPTSPAPPAAPAAGQSPPTPTPAAGQPTGDGGNA